MTIFGTKKGEVRGGLGVENNILRSFRISTARQIGAIE